jgi:RES domain-containing protein
VALAEGSYYLSLQPVPPRARRVLYRIGISLANVVDLSSFTAIEALGVSRATFESNDYSKSQSVGGAAAYLGHDGMLVPSARGTGVNLVVFPERQASTYRFEQLDYEILAPDTF